MNALSFCFVMATLIGTADCLFLRMYYFMKMNLTWHDALSYCRSNYEDMISIGTKVDYDNINTDIFTLPQYWIGLSVSKSGVAEWSDGDNLTFTAYTTHEKNMEYGYCWLSKNCLWHYLSCNHSHPFACWTWWPTVTLVDIMMTWEEALKYCRTNYVDLISLSNQNDLKVLNNTELNIKTPYVWTGLRFYNNKWFWANKDFFTLSFSLPLCPIQPHLCGAKKTGVDTVENRDCNEKMPFICY